RWYFGTEGLPYYTYNLQGKDWSATFVVLDSDCFIPKYQESSSVYFNPYTIACSQDQQTQIDFLAQAFAASTADWKFLQLHHPYMSATSNNTGLAPLISIVEQHSGIVLNGHDHCLAHFFNNNTEFITAGAAGYPQAGDCNFGVSLGPYTKYLAANAEAAANGFVTMDISKEEVVVEYYARDMRFEGGDLYPVRNDLSPSYTFTITKEILFGNNAAQVPTHLVYIEWFSEFREPEQHHGLHKVSPMKDPEGNRICSIIPLANIRRSVHLYPKFGPSAPQEWTSSTVLDLCSTFFVNGISGWGGGLAEYIAVDVKYVHVLPEGLSRACMEPLAVSWHAMKRSGFKQGQSVLILGAGPILRSVDPSAVLIVSEPTALRRQQALLHGATSSLDPLNVIIPETVMNITGGVGVDIAFDAAGVQASMDAALLSVRPRGVVLDIAMWEKRPEVDINLLFSKEITLTGRDHTVMTAFIRSCWRQGKIPHIEDLITAKIAIEDVVEKGFHALIENKDSHGEQ
ncbi:hypothetical protein H0H92_005738, partial [Tricholoma furcatifolium]